MDGVELSLLLKFLRAASYKQSCTDDNMMKNKKYGDVLNMLGLAHILSTRQYMWQERHQEKEVNTQQSW